MTSVFDAARFIAMFKAVADRLDGEKDYLCELDGHIGDADHGIAMSLGFSAVRKAHGQMDAASATPTDVFNTAAKSFLNAVGASSGPLYATAFMRAGAALRGKETASDDDVTEIVQAMARGIQERGKAEIGEKTMIDAWAPAATAVADARNRGGTLDAALAAARKAAEEGAETTKAMVAGKGRSARLGARSIGYLDPGAASAAIIIAVMAENLSS